MKKLFAGLFVWALTLSLYAVDAPKWLRYSAISPDGSTIAFTFKGDIFTVPVTGGKAMQLTSNPAYDTRPVWSPDGRSIAFASDRRGSMDVYVVSVLGGEPQRVTTYSGAEYPVAFRDNERLLFTSYIMPSAEDAQFPSGQFPQIYEVNVKGGRPVMFSSMPMERISFDKDGKSFLYYDKKGYEDAWRKHHVSSITRDIWLCVDKGDRAYRKQTQFRGEDRDPVWAPDGKSFYYLSEEKGSFNVFKRDIDATVSTQITSFDKNPVRFLTVSDKGRLCFGYDGDIYTMMPGEKPVKVPVTIITDRNDADVVKQVRYNGASDMAVSPDGKEVAFIVRGDVFVTSVDYNTTKRITNTPCQERNIEFSPDGRSLVYSSERNGCWQVYQATIVRENEKQFTYATEIKEECLTNSNKTSFEPKYSPDGKEVAFLEDRTAIKVINLKTKAVRTVMDGKYQYSYSDGDQNFTWSPDSKWILSDFIGTGGWNNKDVVLLNADGKGEMYNLTQSGYSDGNAKWVLGGKAMIWKSDRAGYRSHGSWGAQADVYIMFFDLDAYDRFNMSKEDLALIEEAEKEKKDKKESDSGKENKEKKTKTDKDKKEEVKPLELDLENCRDRVKRLTVNSSFLGDALLSPKGDKLYYLAAFEGGFDLWEHNLKENTTRILIKGVGAGSLLTDKDQKNVFMLSGGNMKKIEISGNSTKSISFAADFDQRPYDERKYIFDHAWQQVTDKFYDPDIHGIDWKGYKKIYERFLPYINNNYDFTEMLSEMLGELNASHTGARYSGRGGAFPTAALGLFYEDKYDGDGLKVKEVIDKGPFKQKKSKIEAGCIIEKIDGVEVKKGMDYFPLLEGKVGRKVLLTVKSQDGKKFEETVKAISYGQQNQLLYDRWVEGRRDIVEKLSNGRIGYVHVRSMDSQSFRKVYSDLLGRYRNCDAVVVDTRHNGGGWLHEDLARLLSGKEYQRFVPRGQYIGSDPYNEWTKPSCVLVCEDNYSNAHGFPFVYKELKIGKLVGAPVPGTMTAVWWEGQIDPSIVFGIPQVGCQDMRGNYLENQELMPDIEVYNDPYTQLKGEDKQLEKAVETLLKEIQVKKK
ncbi:S41 family peptidase [Coprobacter tertius]|uniref:Tricorn protease homolog n=1 Tax=Coprobacter tertius TaxID=2944915 RepID=A0ABT1MHB6_9BACT|nr:S41 family peptidase [Coprobacter tertius]MCP9612032.1 S41 family peptidase [Coprobacter tertius]